MSYAKAIAAALAAVLGAVVPAFYTGPLGLGGWVNVILLACGAIQVYNASNDIPGWAYAKMVAAIVTAGGVALSSAISDGVVTRSEWIQIGAAVLSAFAVYRIPNPQRAGRHEK